MSIYIFTGPSLRPEVARDTLDAVYLPPVSQGDVYRVGQRRPVAIGIIDGYFERIPSVWHKEILWAMKEGIHVVGASSMGALRAAELAAFGMEGVGWIYEAFKREDLMDDDEVAVAHASAEEGYLPLSTAMVDMRRTFALAETSNIITCDTHSALLDIAKALFYPQRVYPTVLGRGRQEGLPEAELNALREWLPGHQVDQKRLDALALLRYMKKHYADNPAPDPKQVRFTFQNTTFWDRAIRQAGELQIDESQTSSTVYNDTLIEEMQLEADAYTRTYIGTVARLFALKEARWQGVAIPPARLQEMADTFRQERNLLEGADVQTWLSANNLTEKQFTRFLEDEYRLQWVKTLSAAEIRRSMADYLRAEGAYAHLFARASHKTRVLEAHNLDNPALSDAGLTEEALYGWYFDSCLGRPVPENLAAFAQDNGYENLDALRRALLREYCYIKYQAETP